MSLANIGGGFQNGPAAPETMLVSYPAPATATVTATLTTAQLTNGLLLGSPATTAASYTLPLAADVDTLLGNAIVGHTFEFSVINVDGSGSGVITLVTNTGWTLVGLMTVVATAGTAQLFRARKTGTGTWTLYRAG
jgi:hypothetical protein